MSPLNLTLKRSTTFLKCVVTHFKWQILQDLIPCLSIQNNKKNRRVSLGESWNKVLHCTVSYHKSAQRMFDLINSVSLFSFSFLLSPLVSHHPFLKVSGTFLEAGFETQLSTPGVARRRQWKAQMETAAVENNTKKWKFRRSFPFSSLLFFFLLCPLFHFLPACGSGRVS